MNEERHWAHVHVDPATNSVASHALDAHLRAVADGAAAFASDFGPLWARLAGLWHDLGKFRPGFQQYIRLDADAHIEGRLPQRSDKTHSAAGALHALDVFNARFGAQGASAGRILAYLIAGHHAGLGDWIAGLDDRLFGSRARQPTRAG